MAGTKFSAATETTLQDGDLVGILRPGQQSSDKFVAPVAGEAWASWTPTITGFSANPTFSARYFVIGKMCFVIVTATAHGTSNSTTANGKTMTLPFTGRATPAQNFPCGRITDNGSGQAANGVVSVAANSNIATIYRDGTLATAWTGSGNCSWNFGFAYEIA